MSAKKKPQTPQTDDRARAQENTPAPAPVATPILTTPGELVELDTALLIPTPDNPRSIDPADPDNIDLAESVRTVGILIPLHARPHPLFPGKYDLRAGARRLWAAITAKLARVPVIVHQGMTDLDAYKLTAMENAKRKDLTPFEDARRVIRLMEMLDGNVAEVARILSHPEHWVVCRARLAKLSDGWRAAWADHAHKGEMGDLSGWSVRHMELIARLEPAAQESALVFWKTQWEAAAVSTRDLQNWIDKTLLHTLRGAPWQLDDAGFTDAPACAACTQRTGTMGALFADPDDVDPTDRCCDLACWERKLAQFITRRKLELRREHGDDLIILSDRMSYDAREAARELRAAHGCVTFRNEVQDAKPKDKGAQIALVIDGDRAGETIHVKPIVEPQPENAAGCDESKTATGPGKAFQRPYAELRAELQNTRDCAMLNLLERAIRKTELDNVPWRTHKNDHVMALVECFGTWHRNEYPGEYTEGTQETRHDPLERYGKFRCNDISVENWNFVIDSLWRSVRGVMAHRMISYHNAAPEALAEAPKFAEICGIDLDALRAKAIALHPEPAAWRKLPDYAGDAAPEPHHPAHAPDRPALIATDAKGRELRVQCNDETEKYGVYLVRKPGADPARVKSPLCPDRDTLVESSADLCTYAVASGFTVAE